MTPADDKAESRPLASVIVPTLNEALELPRLLKAFRGARVPLEIIIADGGSTDATRELAVAGGAKVVEARPGRGSQMLLGAERAGAPLLVFLHADARVTEDVTRAIEHLASTGFSGAAAFRFAIDGNDWSYRILELGTRLRGRWLRLPYGDQGLIIDAKLYRSIGGHPPIPLMEDVAIARKLTRFGGIRILPTELRISPRRWERDGPWRRTVANLLLLSRFLLGASPERLAARYDRERGVVR